VKNWLTNLKGQSSDKTIEPEKSDPKVMA